MLDLARNPYTGEMDARDNPYSPGAGVRPMVLAGRDADLAAFDTLLERAELDRPTRGPVLTGLRGMGKTVLLNELAARAVARDWVVIQAEGKWDGDVTVLGQIARELAAELRRRHRATAIVKRALASIKAVTLTLDPSGHLSASIDVEAVASGDLELDFTALARDVGRAARQAGTGVIVCIDELQELRAPSLAALSAAAHAAGQQNLPFFVAGAGLPNLPARIGDAKSYAERLFDYRPLSRLSPEATRLALVEPAESTAASWDDAAASVVVKAADGYPYFVQQFGSATWEVAHERRITPADARAGVKLGQQILDGGFFRSRWDRATPTERQYLAAMADGGDEPSRTPEVAQRMGRTQSNVGPIRAGLIGKGLIYAPEHGLIAFTVPGMAGFIRRQAEA